MSLLNDKELMEKHYPVCWDIVHGDIIIKDKDGNELKKGHQAYDREFNFILEQIDSGKYCGEVEEI
jgi:hypothetical protein|tara:strand:- start:692 stop:889 length:198 start_codon:yes stop_codon:yes gene_type:complete